MSPLLLTLLLLPQSPAAAKYGMHPAKGRVAPSSAQPLPGHYPIGGAPVGLWEVPG